MPQDSKSAVALKTKRVVLDRDNFVAFSLFSLREGRSLQDLVNEALTRERERMGLPLEIPSPTFANSKR